MPGTERGKDDARIEREGAPQGLAMHGEHLSVRLRVGNEQDQAVDTGVALLEERTPLQRLEITEPRLGLDADGRIVRQRPAVERSKIADAGHWYLRRPRERRRQPGSEPQEEAELAGIAHRLADQERPDAECEPDGRTRKGELIDRRVLEFEPFKAAECRFIEPNRQGCLADAQPGRAAR